MWRCADVFEPQRQFTAQSCTETALCVSPVTLWLCGLKEKPNKELVSTRVRRNNVEKSDAVGYIIFFITFIQWIASSLAMTITDRLLFSRKDAKKEAQRRKEPDF
jgi:hypothetical protein